MRGKTSALAAMAAALLVGSLTGAQAKGDTQSYPGSHTLVLPAASFDPLAGLPAASMTAPADGPSLHLVQLKGPTRDAWLDALRARGARIVQYVAPFSYVVLLDASRVDSISSLSFVRWAGFFDPAWRFGLLELGVGGAVNVLVIGREAKTLAALEALSSRLTVTAALPFADVDATGVQVVLPAARLGALASLANVYTITPQLRGGLRDEMSDQIIAGNYNASFVPQVGYLPWLTARGVTGAGVIVAHVDDGYWAGHPDTVGTLSGCVNYAVSNHACRAEVGNYSDFHGQHTGGIVVGTGTAPATDASGFLYGLGAAPGAKLFDQNFISAAALFGYSGPGQYVTLNKDSALGGATVSTNSWGPAGTPRGYDADTREFDQAPRDANPATPAHEPIDFVLSIMNGSGGVSTQGSPDEGKNLLRVGSSKNYRSGSINSLGASSAHGPALDGRRLPDVVAPGENVVSTANPGTIGLCRSPVVGPWAGLYSGCTGTSMSSPHVAGGSALFTEHYRKLFGGKTPSPALTKAAFVNGAVDLFGGKDADNGNLGHVPDNKQGWGRLNMQNVLAGTEKVYVDQTVLLGETGEAYTATVEAVDPSKPVKISLAWTDALGPGLGGATPAWVNDLDLRVTVGQTTYMGNAFGSPSTGWSVAGGAADRKNNLENVYLQSASGPLTIQVSAFNVAGDGVPGNGDDTDQDFALVISNGRLAP